MQIIERILDISHKLTSTNKMWNKNRNNCTLITTIRWAKNHLDEKNIYMNSRCLFLLWINSIVYMTMSLFVLEFSPTKFAIH